MKLPSTLTFLLSAALFLTACNSGSGNGSTPAAIDPSSLSGTPEENSKFFLEGTLTNTYGDPVIGVGVSLSLLNGASDLILTQTDDSGAFSLELDRSLKPEDIRIIFITGAGSQTLDPKMESFSNQSARADFILNEDSGVISLEGVSPGITEESVGSNMNSCTSNTDCAEGTSFCFFTEGDCGEKGPGVCRPRPEACTMIYAPVCGCDGVTHGSDCAAAGAGVSVRSVGECAK